MTTTRMCAGLPHRVRNPLLHLPLPTTASRGKEEMQYRATDVCPRSSAYRVRVDRSAQIQQLPLALAVALRLHEARAGETLIATALAIEPDGVAPLLDLARAKLARIARTGPNSEEREPLG